MKKIISFFEYNILRIRRFGHSCLIIILLIGCNNDHKEYVDFLKVSDDTYIGIEALIDSLDVPWDIQYNEATNSIFFTEIKGQISELNLQTNERRIIYEVPDVHHQRTAGLLGLAIHPDFEAKPYLYICYTVKEEKEIFSKLVRLRYEMGQVTESKILLHIEGGTGHNGSRLTFDKEDVLYWATGDVHSETHAQDSTTLNGKILRMTDEGEIPSDNPIFGSYVYAWGFRNIQGLTVTSKGNIMVSEHGDAIEDELNWIRPLHNYGWKKIEGFHDTEEEKEYAERHGTTEPVRSWTPVIAPAALHYPLSDEIPEWKNSMLLGTLKDQSMRVLVLNEEQTDVIEEKVYLKDVYGRIRAITSDGKGNIYIATSNRDWKTQTDFPKSMDDRILKLSKIDVVPERYLEEEKFNAADLKNGKALYQAYCASCHLEDGEGINETFPSLVQTSWVREEDQLLDVLLNGLKGKIVVDGLEYDEMMPAFDFLSDREIAEIATYVRSSFGNNYSAIDSATVQESRGNK